MGEKKSFKKIVSGGQTGVDRAALDLALELKIPCGGWCPKDRYAEDGRIAAKYPLTETPSTDVAQRTEWNVRDSDGTLIISQGQPKDGTNLTYEMTLKYQKPTFLVDLQSTSHPSEFAKWVIDKKITVLNIAGPRESHAPGEIYTKSLKILRSLLSKC